MTADAHVRTRLDDPTARPGYRRILTPILRLLPFLGAFKGLFAVTLITMILYHASTVAVSALSAWIVAGAVSRGLGGGETISLFVSLAAAILGAGVFMWLNSWYAHFLSYRIIARLRINVYDAIARINPAGLQNRRTGDIAAATMADLEALEWFYAHTIADLIAACATALLLTVPLVVVLGPYGLLPLVGAIAILALPLATLPIQMRQGVRLRQEMSSMKASTLEGLQGMRDIVSLGLTRRFIRDTEKATRRVQRAGRAYTLRAGVEKSLEDVIATLLTVGMLVVMLRLHSAGELPLVLVPIVQVGIAAVLRVVISVAGMLRKLGEISAASARFLLIDDAPEAISDPPDPRPIPREDGLPIRFEGVRFSYPGGREVLKGVDLRIEAGSTVALVGRSGSGKSTMASLLLRLWDVDSGIIRVGDLDIRETSRRELRSVITLVSQTPYVFSGTVRYNLSLGSPGAEDEKMWAALEAARLRGLVESLPGGLDAELGERAANLSGGQRQRLNLAQAFLRDTPIVVMDESVSHLDPELERELNAATSTLMRGRTTLIIAHRLSTIEQADLVAVLDEGAILQVGSHRELVASNPRYVEILADQLKTQDGRTAVAAEP